MPCRCNKDVRVSVEALKMHPFFKGTNWATLNTSKAPFVPEVLNLFDASFYDCPEDDEMDEQRGALALETPARPAQRTGSSPKPNPSAGAGFVDAKQEVSV